MPRDSTSKRRRRLRQKIRQSEGFLNRYDFAYAGRDTINQALKILNSSAPALVQNLSGELNKILEERIAQLIKQGGEQLKELGPQLFKTSHRRRIQNAV